MHKNDVDAMLKICVLRLHLKPARIFGLRESVLDHRIGNRKGSVSELDSCLWNNEV